MNRTSLSIGNFVGWKEHPGVIYKVVDLTNRVTLYQWTHKESTNVAIHSVDYDEVVPVKLQESMLKLFDHFHPVDDFNCDEYIMNLSKYFKSKLIDNKDFHIHVLSGISDPAKWSMHIENSDGVTIAFIVFNYIHELQNIINQATNLIGINMEDVLFLENVNTDEIVDKLHRGIVKFKYFKKDGTERLAVGTLNTEVISDEFGSDYLPKGSERKYSEDSIRYFDMQAKGWRSFSKNNFKHIISYDLI